MCLHNRMVPSIPLVSPRTFITTIYHVDKEEGEYIWISSAKGNESLREKHKAALGEDVVADLKINMMKFSPKFDASGELVGTEFQQVQAINPNGDLPDMLKTKMVEGMSNAIVLMTEEILKQRACRI